MTLQGLEICSWGADPQRCFVNWRASHFWSMGYRFPSKPCSAIPCDVLLSGQGWQYRLHGWTLKVGAEHAILVLDSQGEEMFFREEQMLCVVHTQCSPTQEARRHATVVNSLALHCYDQKHESCRNILRKGEHTLPSCIWLDQKAPVAHLASSCPGRHPGCCPAAGALHLQIPCTSWHSLASG